MEQDGTGLAAADGATPAGRARAGWKAPLLPAARSLADVAEVRRADIEDFLFAEAELLTAWLWDDWLALFVEGGRYEVPTFDASGSGRESQYFISDDWDLLNARVIRMRSRQAHAENPASHTSRLIGNVVHRVVAGGAGGGTGGVDGAVAGEDRIAVHANFVVHRVRDGLIDPYVGRYEHELVVNDGALRFLRRRAVLLTESVRPGTRLSFIL